MSKEKKKISDELLKYLKMGNPLIANLKKIPLDESLVELGYLDFLKLYKVSTFLTIVSKLLFFLKIS